MIEHFRTALRAAVAAADAWMDSSDRSRSSKTYAGMEAACSAVALSVPDARRTVVAATRIGGLWHKFITRAATRSYPDAAVRLDDIERTAGMLKMGGQCWLTANRHLPYEALLKAHFSQTTLVADENGFKVYASVK